VILTPVYEYNHARDAYLMRGVGRHVGPVLRPERRARRHPQLALAEGADRRRHARQLTA
jgi:hypothetical protein